MYLYRAVAAAAMMMVSCVASLRYFNLCVWLWKVEGGGGVGLHAPNTLTNRQQQLLKMFSGCLVLWNSRYLSLFLERERERP